MMKSSPTSLIALVVALTVAAASVHLAVSSLVNEERLSDGICGNNCNPQSVHGCKGICHVCDPVNRKCVGPKKDKNPVTPPKPKPIPPPSSNQGKPPSSSNQGKPPPPAPGPANPPPPAPGPANPPPPAPGPANPPPPAPANPPPPAPGPSNPPGAAPGDFLTGGHVCFGCENTPYGLGVGEWGGGLAG